jgi:hypothetical protein
MGLDPEVVGRELDTGSDKLCDRDATLFTMRLTLSLASSCTSASFCVCMKPNKEGNLFGRQQQKVAATSCVL